MQRPRGSQQAAPVAQLEGAVVASFGSRRQRSSGRSTNRYGSVNGPTCVRVVVRSAAHSSRGCAFGDFDNDGDMDVLIMNMNEPPSLLRNDLQKGDKPRHWIKVKLIGTKSNRSAIGSRVIASYGGKKQAQEVMAQSSYFSVNDSRLHFGLGELDSVDIAVRWISGRSEEFLRLEADRLIVIREGEGIIHSEKFPAHA